MKRQGCKALRYFDHYQCLPCGKQWDVNDEEPPECTPPRPAMPPQFKETLRLRQSKMIAELRRNLSEPDKKN